MECLANAATGKWPFSDLVHVGVDEPVCLQFFREFLLSPQNGTDEVVIASTFRREALDVDPSGLPGRCDGVCTVRRPVLEQVDPNSLLQQVVEGGSL